MTSKTDRELLELAAKAVGISAEWKEYTNAPPTMVVRYDPPVNGITGYDWNPLADDGDALRLAVKRLLRIWTDGTGVVVESSGYPAHAHVYELAINNGGDIYAATRRAIVRAAAAIGESMP